MDRDGRAAVDPRAALEQASATVATEWAAACRSAPPYWLEGIPPRLVARLDELGALQRTLRECEHQPVPEPEGAVRVAEPDRAPRPPRGRSSSGSAGSSGSPFPGSLPLWGS